MKEWRVVKIKKISGGGFLAAAYPPGSQANYAAPVIEQAFSTSGEVLDWLAGILEMAHTSTPGWEEPGEES